ERQEADIARATAVAGAEERARDERHQISEETALSLRKRTLETRLGVLQLVRDEAVAAAKQEKEIADERARILSEQQRFVLERRWEVEQEEIRKQQALEAARIQKDVAIIAEADKREAAEIRSTLGRQLEIAETQRLGSTAEREKAEHTAESVRVVADAERARQVELIAAAKEAETRRIDEESKPQVMRMHTLTQSEARKAAAILEADATL